MGPRSKTTRPGRLILVLMLFTGLSFLYGCHNIPRKAPVDDNTASALKVSGPVVIPADFVFNPNVTTINFKLMGHPRGIGSPSRFDTLKADPGGIEYRMIVDRAAELGQMIASGAKVDPEDVASAPVLYALAYRLSGRPEFLDMSRQMLNLMLDRKPWNISPETSNFEQLQRAQGAAVMYDVLYDALTDDEKEKVESFLVEYVIPMVRYKTFGADESISFWVNDPHSNYYVVWHATLGWLALVLGDTLPGYQLDVSYAWEKLKPCNALLDTENGWREGLTYLDFCWGQKAYYFFLALGRNSDLNPWDGASLGKSAEFAAYGILPGGMGSNSFGDNEPKPKPGLSYILRMRALHPNPNWDKIASMPDADTPLDHDAWVFYAMAEPVAGDEGWSWFDKLPRAKYFPGIEWTVARTGWGDPSGMYFACKSGAAGYGHNHLDQCSVMLAAGGQWLLFDKGVGGDMSTRWADPVVNNYFEAPVGHNTLVVGDGIYEDLGMWPDNPKYFAKPGKILDYKELGNGRYITFTCDGSGLFPTEPLTFFRRHICIDLDPPGGLKALIYIVDEVRLSQEMQVHSAWHSRNEWQTHGQGAMSICGDVALRILSDSDKDLVLKTSFQDTKMEDRNTYVLEVGPEGATTNTKAGYIISATAKDAGELKSGIAIALSGVFEFDAAGERVWWDPEPGTWDFGRG